MATRPSLTILALAGALAAGVAGCGTVDPTSTVALAPPPITTSAGPTATILYPGDVTGYEIGSIEVRGTTRRVAIADTEERRHRGLRDVANLGNLSGMLFVFDTEVTVSFTMNDTLIPLDLHLLSAEGEVLEIIPMEPCDGPSCTFTPSVRYRYALETEPGALGLEVGDVIVIGSDR